MPKKPLTEYLWRVNMLKGLKDCLNLQGSIFFILFDKNQLEKLCFSSI